MSDKKNKVMVFGTFDIFHKGHESFLRQAKKQGSFLVVSVGRDKVVEKVKGKLPRNNEKKRRDKIKESGLADRVILGGLKNMYAQIRKERPDIICLGYDQLSFVDRLPQKLLEFGMKNVKIIKLRPYRSDIYKSSKL